MSKITNDFLTGLAHHAI